VIIGVPAIRNASASKLLFSSEWGDPWRLPGDRAMLPVRMLKRLIAAGVSNRLRSPKAA